MWKTGQKVLLAYSVLMSTVVAVMILMGARASKTSSFDEINVERINIVEPDGTLRVVLSNHAKLPGIIVRRKEQAFPRPQAGMLFYNDEGSENGGLVFGGHKNAKGEVEDSGGSLSFDKYEANQIVQLAGVDDKEDRFAGLIVTDNPKAGDSRRRLWAGRESDGTAAVSIMDANGRKRISMEVTADGTSHLSFFDATGKVINEIPSSPTARLR
jgi:hypothetical protein